MAPPYVRSTASTRASSTTRSRSAPATRSTASSVATPPTAIRAGPGRDRPVRVSRPLLYAPDGLTMKLPLPPLSTRAQAPGETERVKPLDHGQGGRDLDASTGSTSAPRSPGPALDDVPKVPKGTNWFYTLGSATLFAFLRRPSRACSSRCTTGPRSRTRTSPPATSPTRCSSASSCAACTSGARSMMVILIFLHMARDVLLRRLQVPARAQLDHRRRAADPDVHDVADRLPAAVRPALLLGDRGQRRTSPAPARSSARSWPTSCAAEPSSGRRRCRASTRSTCCSSQADRCADRRAPVPRRAARDDRAALAAGREPARAFARSRSSVNQREKEL